MRVQTRMSLVWHSKQIVQKNKISIILDTDILDTDNLEFKFKLNIDDEGGQK